MKRTFSWLASLCLGMMLLITSCSNSSQITFKNTNTNGVNKDGLSGFTILLPESGRAAVNPEDWTEDKKKTLLYKLSGSVVSGTSTVNLATAGEAAIFTWDEIKKGTAIVYLDPMEWNLTLSAYQVASVADKSNAQLDDTTIVLESTPEKVSLLAGSAEQVFALAPKVGAGSTTYGDLDVTVKFHDEVLAEVDSAKFSLYTKEDILAADVIKADSPVKTEYAKADFAKIGADNYSSIAFAGKVKAGEYLLQLEFINKNTQVIDVERWPVRVDGNNRSKGTIIIDKDSFAKVPKQPTNLTVSTAFKPTADKVEMFMPGSTEKILAQDVAENTSPAAAPAICTSYNATFEWVRESYNETKYELKLATSAGDVVITTNTSGTKETDNCLTISGTGTKGIKWVAGSLHPGSEMVEITIPTGVEITAASIAAQNEIKGTITPTDMVIAAGRKIGMFTVTYALTTYSVADPTGKQCFILYSTDGKNEAKTANQYFVMAYDFGTTVASAIKTGPEYPCITMNQSGTDAEKYRFGGWQKYENGDYNKPNCATGTLAFDNKDITVYPIWTSPLLIKVTFPEGLQKYDTLDVTDDPSHILKTKINTTTPLEIKVATANGKGTISNYKYKVTKNDGSGTVLFNNLVSSIVNDGSKFDVATDGTLKWTTDTATNGDYIVYIQYDFTSTDSKVTTTIGGSIHVQLDVADPNPAP